MELHRAATAAGLLAPRCAQGGTSPAVTSLGHHHDSDWLRAIAPRPSPALHPTSSTTATLRETELELILMVQPNGSRLSCGAAPGRRKDARPGTKQRGRTNRRVL